MWSDISIAARNLLRNPRRTLTTVFTVVIGCIAVMIIGGFSTAISLGLETSIARKEGHLHIYPQGYLEYGAANPTAYAISHPDQLIDAILALPGMKERVLLAVPILKLNGIAGNFPEEASKTFLGYGIRPRDIEQLARWDGYGLGISAPSWRLAEGDTEGAVVGIGLARMLSLCDELKLSECRDRPRPEPLGTEDPLIKQLQQGLQETAPEKAAGPLLDLLASTGQGAPNVVSVMVRNGARQAVTAVDDMFVGMHLEQAQKLIFNGSDKATAITIQLRSLADAPEVKALLERKLPELYPQDLEVRELGEFDPMFLKILAMFNGVFVFVALVIAIVVLFTVANTMTTSVLERTSEVGTLRALGLKRSGIRRQFIIEGSLIGAVGGSCGVILGVLLAGLLNHIGLSWTPPSSPVAQKLVILPLAEPLLPLSLWLAMILITVLSSLAPASRAARQNIVDAIHHV